MGRSRIVDRLLATLCHWGYHAAMKARFQKKHRGNRLVDRIRDGSGRATISDEHGNIVCLKSIGDRLYILADRGVVSGQMADGIDPERTNEAIPPFVQRTELSYGVDHTFIKQTLGAAFQMIDLTYLPASLDQDEARALAFEAASALAAIHDVTEELRKHQNETQSKLTSGEMGIGHLPRTPNLKGRLHGCISHLREVETAIAKLTLLFHPKAIHNDPWQKAFGDAVAAKHGEDSEPVRQLGDVFAFLRRAVEHRHAMIHPNTTKRVVVHDYTLRADSSLWTPSLEIAHPDFSVERQDAFQFFTDQAEGMGHAFEIVLGHLCAVNARVLNDMFETRVALLPDGELRFGSRLVWDTIIRPEFADRFPPVVAGAAPAAEPDV